MTTRPLSSWPRRFGTAVSQFFNVLLNGGEDESISSRAWKARERGKRWGKVMVPIIDALFGKGHCERAVERDEL